MPGCIGRRIRRTATDLVTTTHLWTGLDELENHLTWRFAGAMLAQTGMIVAAGE